MQEPTVRCGCGRTMALDARQGRGAYRCGCGARVQISPGQQSTATPCVGQASGKPCWLPPITDEPFTLCLAHYRSSGLKRFHELLTLDDRALAEAVMDIQQQRFIDDADNEFVRGFHENVQRWVHGIRVLQRDPDAARRHADAHDPENAGVVYFIRSNNSVKIGKTTDVDRRMTEINAPNLELLATEPGYTERERILHLKFGFYRTSGEWFDLGPGLVDYINRLRQAAGKRPIAVPKEHVDKIRTAL